MEESIEAVEGEYTDNTKLVCEFTVQVRRAADCTAHTQTLPSPEAVQTLFNFLSCTAVATSHQLAAGNALHQTLMVMGAHTVILPMLIFVFMPISGAHFNPMARSQLLLHGQGHSLPF